MDCLAYPTNSIWVALTASTHQHHIKVFPLISPGSPFENRSNFRFWPSEILRIRHVGPIL